MADNNTPQVQSVAGDDRHLRRPLPIGYQLHNRYIITELLSDNGGFGMTYRAVDTYRDLNLDVVVKENFPLGVAMRDSKSLELYPVHKMEELYSKVLKQFEDEAELLTTINHPNIVRVTAHFSELNTAYYVMPYISGTELNCALPHHDRLSEAELLPILRGMLQALHYMHNHKLLHRDIKPNNILIDDKSNPILIDFGLVRSIDKTHHFTRNYTPGFAPLEQITGLGKSGFGTDLYSLGATCYVLITGETPSIGEEDYIPLKSKSELHARFSTAFLAGIDHALRMNINNRWKTANEWLKTLPREKQTDKSQHAGKRSSGFRKVCKILLAVILSLLTITWLVAGYTIGPVAAASNGAATLLQSWLILPGIDVNKTVDGQTPLHWAAQASGDEGYYECVQLLIDAGADVNKLNDDGNTPLACRHFSSLRNPQISISKALIDAGANVNHEDSYGSTILHEVARYNPELLQSAINAGGDINKEDKEGYTPLHSAVEYGKPQCVLVLTDAGADVNKVDKKGTTPLCLAVGKGHPKCARQLIAAGADVNKANAEGETPLTIAVDNDHTECMKLLLNAPGIDVNKGYTNGETLLHRAAQCGSTECVKLLLASGADVNCANTNGLTPLHWAAKYGSTECIKLLLASGADVNCANKYGETPLHRAAHWARTECVRLLLTTPGIDVNKSDQSGRTPLNVATPKCAQLIRAAGGK